MHNEHPRRRRHESAASLACIGGHFDTVQWLVTHLNMTGAGPSGGEKLAERACQSGHLAIAKWCVGVYGVTKLDKWRVLNADTFAQCPSSECLQWMANMAQIIPDDIRTPDERSAFIVACSDGNLAAVQWMAKQFAVTMNELCIGGTLEGGLEGACSEGRTKTSQWLITNYNIPAETGEFSALTNACKCGPERENLELVQWLCARYAITAGDLQDGSAASTACAYASGRVAQFLLTPPPHGTGATMSVESPNNAYRHAI